MLVDAGAKVQVRTADLGNTPLILAARRAGNSRTVKQLLERGASATEHNNVGISPIISGAASGADPNSAGGESVGAFRLVQQTPRLDRSWRGVAEACSALCAADRETTVRVMEYTRVSYSGVHRDQVIGGRAESPRQRLLHSLPDGYDMMVLARGGLS